MPLTSFDRTFDYTFARTTTTVQPSFPPVGSDGGGGISGAVLPLSTNPNLLASCLHPSAQGWERWAGVPIALSSYLLPFILKVPMPDELGQSPFCTEALQIVDADSGAVVLTPYELGLNRVTDGQFLYIIHTGSQLYQGPPQSPAQLPEGTYRIKLASAISDPFRVRSCAGCKLLRIRLLNDTRLGDLLYGTFGFSQLFYVEGDLTGPTYEETETRTASEKTGATLKKIWTLTLEGVSEPIADALAMAGLHRLVEVSLVNGDGTPYRPITAMAHEAKGVVSLGESGGYDVTLTLPVSLTSWGTASTSANACVSGAGSSVLSEIECVIP